MCTLWVIEALARAGEFEPGCLAQAVGMLEDFMGKTFRRAQGNVFDPCTIQGIPTIWGF